jgi:hypothetical protein
MAKDMPSCLPPLRALAPRLACALNRRVFVHFVQSAQALTALVRHAKNNIKKMCKFVHNCAAAYGSFI